MKHAPYSEGPPELQLAGLAAGLSFEDIGAGPLAAFDRLLLDFVAVAVAGAGDATCVRAAGSFFGRCADRPPSAARAFALGTCAHWFDWDDTDDASHVHGGTVVFPALMALWSSGQMPASRRTPGEFIASTIVGFEIACRIGAVLRAGGHRGWMPTGGGGSLGAAAAGARLFDADAERIRSTMGIAAANAGLSRQALADKTNTKGILAGIAAKTAVEAVQLEANGVRGPPAFLAGPYGLGALHTGRGPEIWAGVGDPESTLAVERISLKPYPCCRSAHAVIDAALELYRDDPRLATSVTAVAVAAPPGVVERCGAPFSIGENPRLSAQFSIPYTAAIALSRGRITLHDFLPAVVRQTSAELDHLISSVQVKVGEVVEDVLAPVEVRFMANGKTVRQHTVRSLKGEPSAPLTAQEQQRKLRIAAEGLLDDAEVAELAELVGEVKLRGPDGLIAALSTATRKAVTPG